MSGPADLSAVSFFSPETLVDPWRTYALLRDQAPVYEIPGAGLKVVTRYDLVHEAIRDTKTYSSQFGLFLAGAAGGGGEMPAEIAESLKAQRKRMHLPVDTLLTADEPVHSRYRSLVSELFTAGRVKQAQPQVDAIIDEAIDGFIDAGEPVDFMAVFGNPVPLRVIADRLGVPAEDRAFFYEGATVSAATLRMTTYPPEETLRRATVLADLQDYMVDLVESRRSDPRDDMATALARGVLEGEDRPLDPAELWSILNQFLVAGHETTTSTFGFGMELLCRQPELQQAIRGDANATRAFVEEALRLEAPVQGLPRLVTRDTELGGTKLAKGELVMLRFGAANRDERHFPNPDVVDLGRKNAGSHFSFGSGTHHCPGAPLSRQELNRGFAALLDRMQHIRMSPAHAEPRVEPSMILRSFPSIWIEFERR